MKFFASLFAGLALLAPISTFANEAGQPSDMSWSGFYAGVLGGAGFADFDLAASANGTSLDFAADPTGALLGVRLGADRAIGVFVLGAMADVTWTGVRGQSGIPTQFGTVDYTSQLSYLGTVRMRTGVAPLMGTLLYAHAGLALGETVPALALGANATQFERVPRAGYVVGAGIEQQLVGNLSAVAEYGYVDLGTRSALRPGSTDRADERLMLHTMTLGLNVRF